MMPKPLTPASQIATLLASLVLSMLLVQYYCGRSNKLNDDRQASSKNQNVTPPSPITPITNEMIQLAKDKLKEFSKNLTNPSNLDFLPNKLHALKEQV